MMRQFKLGNLISYGIIALIGYVIVILVSYVIVEEHGKTLHADAYSERAIKLQTETELLINANAEAVMHIALALSQDHAIKSALISKTPDTIDLRQFSKLLRQETPLKNVWFQVIDMDGNSFYRSWTTKRGDYMLNARIDISTVMQERHLSNTISTGKFDMTFKSMVPIFNGETMIGVFEVIAKFNSIALKMAQKGVAPVILVDKHYRKQLIHPFTNLFVGDYYVANQQASAEHLDYLRSIDLERLLDQDRSYIELPQRNEILVFYRLNDVNGGRMGYFLYFVPLDTIDLTSVAEAKHGLLLTISIIYLLLAMLGFALAMRRHSRHVEEFNKQLGIKVLEKTHELDRQHHFLQEVIDGVYESVMVINKDYEVVLMNKVARESYEARHISKENRPYCYEVSHHISEPCSGDAHPCPLREVMKNRIGSTVLHEHRDHSGAIRYFELTASPLFDEKGDVRAIIEVGHDVTAHLVTQTKLREQKESLDFLAHHDPLTGLPNRMLFLDRLEHVIEQSKRYGGCVAVLFLDLDRFKQINDSLGHSAGDELLVAVAKRLSGSVRAIDTVARLGGDEFTVILEGCHNQHDLIEVVEKLLHQASEPVIYGEHHLYTSASIGISVYPYDGDNAETLLKNADAAMYRAKDEGRNTYQFYTVDMTEQAMERVIMESAIRNGLERGEFFLEYQPQYDCRDDTLIGMEALVRWNHPELGRVSPAQFIPLAEESGLIVPMGEKILQMAALQTAAWHAAGLDPKKVSVNLSVKQLRQKTLVNRITAILKETHCAPSWIEIEVTEGYVMEQPEEAINRLHEIRSIGVMLAMDDFGTGYSSLSLLKRLPIQKLKIDASFIRDIPGDEEDEAITCTVIDLARHMHLEVIAEGVEKEEQKAFLQNHGCYHIQGYLYARPQDVSAITRLLESFR